MSENRPTITIKGMDVEQITQEELLKFSGFSGTGTAWKDMESDKEQPLTPPYDFDLLTALVNCSGALMTAIIAIVTNTKDAGYGFIPSVKIEPVIEEDEAGNKITKYRRKDNGEFVDEEWMKERQQQYQDAVMFFQSCTVDDESYLEMTSKVGVDLEFHGNGYIEMEAPEDELEGLHHVKSSLIRIFARSKQKVDAPTRAFNPFDLEWETSDRPHRFRRFVMLADPPTFFKEAGDTRLMDKHTGKYYDLLEETPPGFEAASELLHFRIYNPGETYGVPRFIPIIDVVLALRAADLIDKKFMSSSGIPAGLLIIEGYNDPEFGTKIEEQLEHNVKGAGSGSKIVVVQAEAKAKSSKGTGPGAENVKPSIRFEPLAPILTDSDMFGNFTQRNEERVFQTYRLANQYVGRNNDIPRATAETAMDLTESQTFQPIRNKFDAVINNQVMSRLGITHWRYVSKSNKLKNIEALASMAVSLAKDGKGLVPIDVRKIAEEILGESLPDLVGDWQNKPQYVYQAEMERDAQDAAQNIDTEIQKSISDEYVVKLASYVAAKMIGMRDNLNIKGTFLVDADRLREDPSAVLDAMAQGYRQTDSGDA